MVGIIAMKIDSNFEVTIVLFWWWFNYMDRMLRLLDF